MADPTQHTQQATQGENEVDPRRFGRNNSGLNDSDVSDVLCVLHPSSQASHLIVANTARLNPQHILQRKPLPTSETLADRTTDDVLKPPPQQSFDVAEAQDIALRFSSRVCDPTVGFCFGRNVAKCDINLDPNNDQRRVSNTHFRIYINKQGVLMAEDMSTNGTVVDTVTLGGKRNSKQNPKTQILESGSVIEILAPVPNEIIRFVVRIPSRDDHYEDYMAKYQAYMRHVAIAEDRTRAAQQGAPIPEGAARGMLAAPLAGPPNPRNIPPPAPPLTSSNYGMRWDGGGQYKSVGVLGKGAFATVYQLANRRSGEYFAAKELERRRVMKDGSLEHRIDNEMNIMKAIKHENIVQYVDYVETKHHLYIIMEFVPGGDLSGYMQSHGTLPEDMGRSMSRQILQALLYLHSNSITHRDIKPDNILICTEDPFVVKLSDFGLSKVVKSNETFLTTFCGTMLYCAPEVFPQYDAHAAGARQKRRYPGMSPKKNPYSQLVDIWSYAAVLWYVLCGKPPFEGVPDPTGKGMFAMIVNTELDATPLREKHISQDAIDLLLKMLTVNPERRYNERASLLHPWLNDGSYVPDDLHIDDFLEVIDEQDEDLGASQLSLNDTSDEDGKHKEAADGEIETALRSHKRAKTATEHGAIFSHSQADDSSDLDDYPFDYAVSYEGDEMAPLEAMPNPDENIIHSDVGVEVLQQSPKARLFGEITNPVTHSPGQANRGHKMAQLHPRVGVLPNGAEQNFHANESMLREIRDLHMTSPARGNSASSSFKAPRTPEPSLRARRETNCTHVSPNQASNPNDVTPRQQMPHKRQTSSGSSSNGQRDKKSGSSEITPRQPPAFNRQINLPISASLFYDPYDASTHNIEYASRVSGIDFSDPVAASNVDLESLPPAVLASMHSIRPSDSAPNTTYPSQNGRTDSASSSGANLPMEIIATQPSNLLGRLTSTPDSLQPITIPLKSRHTTFGRHPGCTIVYPSPRDTRIPKRALDIWFHAPSIETAKDLTQVPDLRAIIRTEAKSAIRVNGVLLGSYDGEGRYLWGNVYTGDEIIVYPVSASNKVNVNGSDTGASAGHRLAFRCEFFHGVSAKERGERDEFTVMTS